MSYPTPTVAEYLKAPALFATVDESELALKWGARGIESEAVSALYDPADAQAEAARQFAFLRGPLVEEAVIVNGDRRDLFLSPVTLEGYAAGVAFVIGYRELGGRTELNVIRSLA